MFSAEETHTGSRRLGSPPAVSTPRDGRRCAARFPFKPSSGPATVTFALESGHVPRTGFCREYAHLTRDHHNLVVFPHEL